MRDDVCNLITHLRKAGNKVVSEKCHFAWLFYKLCSVVQNAFNISKTRVSFFALFPFLGKKTDRPTATTTFLTFQCWFQKRGVLGIQYLKKQLCKENLEREYFIFRICNASWFVLFLHLYLFSSKDLKGLKNYVFFFFSEKIFLAWM